MAYAVIYSLAQTIDHILNQDENPISINEEKEIKSLLKKVVLLQEFLTNFPKKAMSFETRMRDAANEAEDVIEHFMYEHSQSHYNSIKWAAAEQAVDPTDILYDFRELRRATEIINSIADDAAAIIREESVNPSDRPVMMQSAPSASSSLAPTVETVTVGIDEEVKKIKALICGDLPERQIIPITGMGGIGKTTLAKKVYDDQSVREKFQVRAWVTVSQDHKPENIFADLLYSLEKEVEEGVLESNDTTEDKLYKILIARKYLIVLDDIWSEKAWNDIKKVFGDPRNKNGSRILITTRHDTVAAHVKTSEVLKMKLLEPDQSWSLIKQKVFPAGRQCPPSLEKIGEDIAVSCGGLPLAIVLIAGILLNVSQTPDSWNVVANDVHSAVKNDPNFTNRISLSYTHLPLHLRPCFLYMGGFPEDYEMRLSKIIKLWVAEEFVKDEEEAETYLNNLRTRNLTLVKAIKSNGKVKSCSIHDLVRDLCKRKALDENYERRLSIAHRDLTRLAKAYASTLRSVISFQPNEVSLGSLRKFKLLRVLDVVDTDAYSLPATVFDLFHLRYLAFGCPMEIPTAISKLQNLRALIIRPSKRFGKYSMDEVYLPSEIWMLPLLTHFVSFFDLLPNPKAAASALKNLLTLSVVKKLICTGEMMKLFPKLKKLGITYFGDKYQEDYQLENLVFLDQLEKLTLVLRKGPLVGVEVKPAFPETLRKLTLSGWQFPWDVMDTVGSLPNLEVLKLRDHACKGKTWVTEEGQFLELKFLLIDGSDLEEWDTGKLEFPVLQHLVLRGCGDLKEIPEEIGDITTLKLIEVDRANKSLLECVQQFVETDKSLKVQPI